MKKLVLRYIGRDSFSRPVYEAEGKLYVDVDSREGWAPKIHTKYGNNFDGEPDVPIREDVAVEFILGRDLWDKGKSIRERQMPDTGETLLDGSAPEKKRQVMKVTLYQVIPERDNEHLLFASFCRVKQRCGGRVPAESYGVVYSGELNITTPEEAFVIFNAYHPEGHNGHSMSVSDVLELTDQEGRSEFYFCNPVGFMKIGFEKEKAVKNTDQNEDNQ